MDVEPPMQAQSIGPGINDEDLARLCEMGFSIAEARRALAGSSNRIEDAVRRLISIGA
jgi:hypothetical protein